MSFELLRTFFTHLDQVQSEYFDKLNNIPNYDEYDQFNNFK